MKFLENKKQFLTLRIPKSYILITKKITQYSLVFLIIATWVFSGWPQIWHNPGFPPQPNQVFAATTATKYAGVAVDGGDGLGCTWASPSNATGDTTSTNSNCDISGNNTNTNELELTNFGFSASDVPAGSSIDGVTVEVEYNTEASASNDLTVSLTKDGSTIFDGSDNKGTATAGRTTKTIVTYGGSADGWTASLSQADVISSNFGVILQYNKGQGGGKVNVFVYRVRITIDYTANVAPNVPSQDLPANSATGVSITPNFLMTATDTNSDDLGYKVTIYSASGCSASLVSTHDQSVTSTGWSGTDATCTASPTACYASGTQSDFTLQSGDALSAGTQYWWRASAKDPDGADTFTDSATCNTFTTGAGVVYSVSITSSGTVEYGFVGLSTSTTTVGNGYTQTANHDGSGGPEKINIKTTDATGGVTWSVAGSIGSNQYKHEVSTTSGSTYMDMSTIYITASSSVAVSDTVNLDFRLTTPSASDDFVQKSITITVQAVAP